MKPKTVNSFLKQCVELCEVNRDELKGINKLSESEYLTLGNIRAAIQNELGENGPLLEKHKLKY